MHLMHFHVDQRLNYKAECGEVRIIIYLALLISSRLIEFSAVDLDPGYKSCLSIGQDGQKTAPATDIWDRWVGGKSRARFMRARKNTTLGFCRLSAEHLFHYLEDSYALYFS